MAQVESEVTGLPVGWVSQTIGEIAFLINGDRGKNYPNQDEQLDDGYCLFLNTSNVRKGKFNFDSVKYIKREQHERLSNGTLERNDIAVTIRGTIGNCAIYSDDIPYEVVRINSAMMIVRPSTGIDSGYLVKFISSPAFIEWAIKNHRGTAQPHFRP